MPSESPLDPALPRVVALPGYEFQGELGRGGFGVVYKARHLGLKRLVAVKMIRTGGQADQADLERFQTEAEAVARLQHPNIVQIYEIGTHSGLPYLAFEFCPGGSLDRTLQATTLTPHEAARLVETLARAVHVAHQAQVIHRDLKPANILLADDGTPKLSDFGLAKKLDDAGQTVSGMILGTPSYMAPEQASGKLGTVGAAVDTYALGAILYECLTGRPPFKAATGLETLAQVLADEPVPPRRLQPRVPRDLETVCLKCLHKDPARRYATTEELAADLRRFLGAETILARPSGTVERLGRWCRRRPLVAGLAAALVLAIVGGFAGIFWKWREAEGEKTRAEHETTRALHAEAQIGEKLTEAINARNDAIKAHKEAQQARASESKALTESKRTSARLALERGLALCEQGEVGHGLQWFVECVRHAPAEDEDLHRVARLNLATWSEQLPRLRGILGPDKHVRCVAWSANGRTLWIGTGQRSEAGETCEWDLATGKPVGEVRRHPGGQPIALSADGQTVVLRHSDSAAFLWDSTNPDRGKDRQVVPAKDPVYVEPPPVFAVFRAQGRLLAMLHMADRDHGQCQLWDTATGEKVGPALLAEGRMNAAAFRPDGKQILTASGSWFRRAGLAQVWDVATGKPIGEIHKDHNVTVADWSPDGKTLLTADTDRSLRLWDAATLAPIGQPIPQPFEVQHAAFSPDGQSFLTVGADGGIVFWDLPTRRPVGAPMPHQGGIAAVAYHPGGRHFATVVRDAAPLPILSRANISGPALLWDVPTDPAQFAQVRLRDPGEIRDRPRPGVRFRRALYTADGSTVLLESADHWLRLAEPETGRSLGQPMRMAPFVGYVATSRVDIIDRYTGGPIASALAFYPGENQALTRGIDMRLRRWDLPSGTPDGQQIASEGAYTFCISPDGKQLLLARGTPETTTKVEPFDAVTGKPLANVQGFEEKGIVVVMAFSPDSRSLATGSAVLQVREAGSWKPIGSSSYPFAARPIKDLAFSPDSRSIISLSNSSSVMEVWNTADAKRRGLLGHNLVITQGIFSPDSQSVLTASYDGTARLWDATTCKPRGPAWQHATTVQALAFSPDGRLALTGCEDGAVRLWDVRTSKPVGPPWTLRFPIIGVAFRSDGRTLLATTDAGTTWSHPVPEPVTGELEHLAEGVRSHTATKLDADQSLTRLGLFVWLGKRKGTVEDAATDAVFAWHQARLREAEEVGSVFGAQQHLDQMLALRPEDGLLYARRGHGKLVAADPAATADFKRAEELGGLETILDWYRQRLVDSLIADQHGASLWYLTRLIEVEPREWALYTNRAAVHRALGHADSYLADLLRALEQGGPISIQVDVANQYAAEGKWEEARASIGQALNAPGGHAVIEYLDGAVAALKVKKLPMYRMVRERVLSTAAQQPETILGYTLKIATLSPDALKDPAALVSLAEKLDRANVKPSPKRAIGATYYRAGNYEEALRRLEKVVLSDDVTTGLTAPFLAMTHHQMGHADEAKRWLEQAGAACKSTAIKDAWVRAEIELLHEEAEEMLKKPRK